MRDLLRKAVEQVDYNDEQEEAHRHGALRNEGDQRHRDERKHQLEPHRSHPLLYPIMT